MATLRMTPVVDAPRPNKRFRRSTTNDSPVPRTPSRPSRSASTSSYPHPTRRNSTTTPTPHANAHSRTSSFSHGSPFVSSTSRSRSAAEARALLLDPAYSGVCHGQQARVFVDESGVAHDPDYRMFPPAVPSSPPRSNMARRGSTTSARGSRYLVGSAGGCSDVGVSPFAGSPFAGYVDFTARYSTSAGHHAEDSDDEVEAQMDIDEDAESELEWSRLHASASPPGYGSNSGSGSATQEGGDKPEEDGYADFAGMEWDEKEWRREEVVPALDKHTPAPTSAKGKLPASQSPPQAPALDPAPASAKSYPKSKSKSKKAKAESVSSATARGYVPAKRSYDESVQDDWTRLRRVFAAATNVAAAAPSINAEPRA
ncbi:hypothetical protein FRC07_007635 [Ceratobasidium sp. 392]|nr:hypothetical protein FRC07_007635 [Ceratobasidium sp. 392]